MPPEKVEIKVAPIITVSLTIVVSFPITVVVKVLEKLINVIRKERSGEDKR